MKTVNDITLSVDDLAGRWTEPALRLLNSAGVHPISVDLELATWRTLEKVLRAELGFRQSTSLIRLKERAIHKAAGLVARKFGFSPAFSEAAALAAGCHAAGWQAGGLRALAVATPGS